MAESSPAQAKKARQEMEVAQLLDKLQPAMITLDAATIGQVSLESCSTEVPVNSGAGSM
jgi:BING4CT (NUC141) domain